MKIKIAPSLLSADFSNLGRAAREAEDAGADLLHFDIMDGHFVPNITFGPMVVRAVRPLARIPFETHLMISNPDDYIEEFVDAGADAVGVHVETCPHLHRTVQRIKSLGAQATVVLNPATPVGALEEIVDYIDAVLVMTVNPGFGAQEFIESMPDKIARTRAMLDRTGREIDLAVDGGVSRETVRRVVEAGANVLIAGNSVFTNPEGAQRAVGELRKLAEAASASWICTSSG
ncbi:MAG: ribulose-phosphate 3-epimerase [Armatimonadota bacterium]|nr:ribulose-phosphate 3-epimerase [Armatimonadota bacterium]